MPRELTREWIDGMEGSLNDMIDVFVIVNNCFSYALITGRKGIS